MCFKKTLKPNGLPYDEESIDKLILLIQTSMVDSIISFPKAEFSEKTNISSRVSKWYWETESVYVVFKEISMTCSTNSFVKLIKLCTLPAHPNLLKLFGICESNIVMEYAKQTLSQYLKTQQLSIVEIRNIALQAAKALEYLHKKQLVHSNIKPANYMVRKSKQLLTV